MTASPALIALLPRDKHDTSRAAAIVALGMPAIAPLLPALLEWTRDLNWPVAQVLQPFLADIGIPLSAALRNVLTGDDDIWKYWVLTSIVAASPELIYELSPELQRLAHSPRPGERAEAVDEQARVLLCRIKARPA